MTPVPALAERSLFDWPDWFPRRFVDWPARWSAFLEEPAFKVEETMEEGTLVVRAELPGVDPDEGIDVTMVDGGLRIRAERKQMTKEEDKGFVRSEFRYGSFVRTVPMPAGARPDDIKATYADGILEVRVPVQGEPETRTIPITRA